MSLDHIWDEMEQVQGAPWGGWVQRRVLPASNLDVFLAVDRPSNQRMLVFSVNSDVLPQASKLRSSRGVAITVTESNDSTTGLIILTLREPRYQAVFSSLCGDLIDVLNVTAADETNAVQAFVSRVMRWQRFLEHAGPDPLSEDAQLGLYAELWFLFHYLLHGNSRSDCISRWTGPEGTAQDFQLHGVAIETKATRQSSPAKVIISNERQLDSFGVDRLFLVHTLWDVRKGRQSTLPELVDSVLAALPGDEQHRLFLDKLLGAGIIEDHFMYYADTSYALRHETVYDVRDSFPKLTEGLLPSGISTVRYSINLELCRPYIIHSHELETAIAEAFDGN